jgi:hypothetical protein
MKVQKTIILSVVLYGCKSWSLILREEYRLRVFENRMLRRMIGERKSGMRLDNIALCRLHNLYSSPSVIRMVALKRMKGVRHVAYIKR